MVLRFPPINGGSLEITMTVSLSLLIASDHNTFSTLHKKKNKLHKDTILQRSAMNKLFKSNRFLLTRF